MNTTNTAAIWKNNNEREEENLKLFIKVLVIIVINHQMTLKNILNSYKNSFEEFLLQ